MFIRLRFLKWFCTSKVTVSSEWGRSLCNFRCLCSLCVAFTQYGKTMQSYSSNVAYVAFWPISVVPELRSCSCCDIRAVIGRRVHLHTHYWSTKFTHRLIVQTNPFTSVTQRGPQPSAHVTLFCFLAAVNIFFFSHPSFLYINLIWFFFYKENLQCYARLNIFILCSFFLNEQSSSLGLMHAHS